MDKQLENSIEEIFDALMALDPTHPLFGIIRDDHTGTFKCAHCENNMGVRKISNLDELVHRPDCPAERLRKTLKKHLYNLEQ